MHTTSESKGSTVTCSCLYATLWSNFLYSYKGLPLKITAMAASLLAAESGPASIPVEFVQTSCSQPETYPPAPSTPQKSTTNTVTIAYTTAQQLQPQGASATETNLNSSLQTNNQSHVTGVAQSLGTGSTSQQHSVGTSCLNDTRHQMK